MWKIAIAFIVFSVAALYFIMNGGDKVNMAGEAGHGNPTEAPASAPATPATLATPAPASPAATK
jgi:hypothetical protein